MDQNGLEPNREMTFLKEPEPPRGVALDVLPGVKRVVAGNAASMTYHGTNTYLIDDPDGGLIVFDPGPDLPGHVAAIVKAGGGRIRRILLSHTHSDHVGATAELKAATGAPTYGWKRSATPSFEPDFALDDGDTISGLTAIFTPGHAADHLCFAWRDGILFSGDHVMGWSSSVVSPPLGDMKAYLASLELLLDRSDTLYLCGHGPALPNPQAYVRLLIAHRRRREEAISRAIAARPQTTAELVSRLYAKTDPMLRRAAERNVLAHLIKLDAEGRVTRQGNTWRINAQRAEKQNVEV
jgi:glyoxylase-like metal-dependent hydrolase (beta-lactamase superfamily II)